MDYSPYEHVPTFSQRHGLREMPGPPQLGEISGRARNNLWSTLWKHMQLTATPGRYAMLDQRWRRVFETVHLDLFVQPLDDFTPSLSDWRTECRSILLDGEYHECLDLLDTLVRHPHCPGSFVGELKDIFRHQLAYRIDTTTVPTIVPAATEQEGDALVGAIQDLESGGLGGAATHLRQAGERIRDRDWPGSVRESIHAVESVAKRIDPGSAGALGKLLAVLEGKGGLHGALKAGFSSLYGYTSDEPGIRHALLDDESKVTQDEAIYMIGACAAFCSYLWRKYGPPHASPPAKASTP